MSDDALPFRYRLRVRYAECDAQRVVFNARYGEYVDVAVGEFLRALGYVEGSARPQPEFQLVKQTTEWFAPSRYDEVVELRVAATHLGNTSFSLRTSFHSPGDPAPRARTETVYVHVDPQSFAKAPLPTELRQRLERGAPGILIDHAGSSGPSP